MITEEPTAFVNSVYREFHVGHFHKRNETKYNTTDTHESLTVRVLPSLCGTDEWHFSKGFIGSDGVRSAEAFLWGKHTGYIGQFSSNYPNLIE